LFTLQERDTTTTKPPPRGLSCDETGVHFGGDCELIAPDALGRYRVRDIEAINRALSAGYGFPVDVTDCLPALERLAKLLSDGAWSLAEIATLHLRLPDLPDEDAADRLRKAEQLLRSNDHHKPPGPGGGQFAPAAGGSSAADAIVVGRGGARFGQTRGVAVTLPNGRPVLDPGSPTGHLMSPVANLANVAAAGRDAGTKYRALQLDPDGNTSALTYLVAAARANLTQGGTFDYQRKRDSQGFIQLPQFRPVANFNVGLYMQQAGVFSLDETLQIAGRFAGHMSSNARPDQPYELDPVTAHWIEQGYRAGESGAFGSAVGQ
jgi:hypothetical protein